ncbi:uncharacterized protein LOC112598630 isoform X1 [Melanaphis sacchari]|uniref:uncharacterized protein LOC112598630 isoform X1 n=1 Tax=Melanaphis sacchari TaxID=742174 RepID=UPI000DC1432D|nr:uncharacterized protein LOC112598630 isoform X1 [Melanaphis sacchari]
MRTSRICLILISTLVVQISSETTETTLSKLTDKIMRSTINIAAKPIGNLVHEVQDSNPEITQYLKDFTRKVKRTLEQTQQELFNLQPLKDKEVKKIIGYSSLYASEAFSKVTNTVTSVTNKSFDALPDDIKTKILDFGNDINNYLNKLQDFKVKNSESSEETPVNN